MRPESNDMTLPQAAASYASRGFRVFRCRPRGKKPHVMCKSWTEEATSDIDKVTAWWAETPNANIGLVTGGALGLVIDIDAPDAEELLPVALESERWTRTGRPGGRHLFFALPPGVDHGNGTGDLPPGLDVRGAGGYVVAPPSIHPKTGARYEWGGEGDPSPIPPQILALLKPRARRLIPQSVPPRPLCGDGYGMAALEQECAKVASAVEGRRNSTLNTAAFKVGQLVAGENLSRADAEGRLLLAAASAGLGNSEAVRTIRSGLDAGTREPRRRAHDAPRGYPAPYAGPCSAWPALAPLEPDVSLPPFPRAALPAWVLPWAESVEESMQVPFDLVGMLALGVLSAACTGRAEIAVKARWREPLNLWVVVVLPPSTRKSPVFSAATAPLEEWERRNVEEARPDVARAHARLAVERGQLRRLEEEAVKADDEVSKARLLESAQDQAAALGELTVPEPERLLVEDITPETLVTRLAANGGRAALFSDEGGVFGTVAGGRYQKMPHIDALLKSYSGQSIRVERRGRVEFVQRATLAMAVTCQPHVLAELFGSDILRERGFLARMLLSVPSSNIGTRRPALSTPGVCEAATRAWVKGVNRLLSLEPSDGEPLQLTVSAEARAAMLAFEERLEARLAEGGDLASVQDWAGKLLGAIFRIAGIIHLAEQPATEQIGGGVAGRAIEVGEYALAHASEAFGYADRGTGWCKAAKAILVAIRRQPDRDICRRDLWSRLKRKVTTQELDLGLAALVQRGYLKAAGRRGTYVLRPGLHDVGDVAAGDGAGDGWGT